MMAQLIQIGKVAPEQVGLAVGAIAGMAEVQGKSIDRIARTFAEQMARATMAGSTSLGEYELHLDDVEAKRIRSLKEAGKSAEATAAYVEALNNKFGEQGKVIKGSTQTWTQLKNQWGDFIEVIGQFIHELFIGLMPALKGALDILISWGPTLRLVAHVAANFFSLIYNQIATTINLLRAFPTAIQFAFATAFEQAINIVIRGINYFAFTGSRLVSRWRKKNQSGRFYKHAGKAIRSSGR